MRVFFIIISFLLLAFVLSFNADAKELDQCDKEELSLIEFCDKNPSKICKSFSEGKLVLACVF